MSIGTRAPLSSLVAAGVVLLVAGAVGGTAGVVVDRYVLIPRQFSQRDGRGWRGGGPGFGRGFDGRDGRGGRDMRGGRPGGPGGPGREMNSAMLGLSDLTPEQQTKIDTLLARQVRGFNTYQDQMRGRIDSLFLQTRAAIDSILTPAQREQLKKQRDSDRGRGGPWDRSGPPNGERGRDGPRGR